MGPQAVALVFSAKSGSGSAPGRELKQVIVVTAVDTLISLPSCSIVNSVPSLRVYVVAARWTSTWSRCPLIISGPPHARHFFMLGRLRRTIQPRSELPSPGTAESGSGPPELPGIRCGIGLDHLDHFAPPCGPHASLQ